MDDTPQSGLGPIALALSGGGFRAAGFHLGVLTTLQRLGLLDQVRVLSTAAGGSLVGARWMLGLARNESFQDTHFHLSTFLTEARPIPAALRRAARERITLTQALAEELETALFLDSRFSDATLREIFEARTHIEEGSFNSALGSSGAPFRFAFSLGAGAPIGNGDLKLPRILAQHLRLSDVVAASTAFPGAFEPMVMPQDFTWPDDKLAQEASEAFEGESHGLVDGGIFDNQAISAMVQGAKRFNVPGATPIGVYLVSDADRRIDAEQARVPGRSGFPLPGLRVWHLVTLCVLGFFGAAASIFLTWKKVEAERAIDDFRWPNDAIAFGVPLALAALVMVGLLYAWSATSKLLSPLHPHLGKQGLWAMGRLRIRDLLNGLQTRIKTLDSVASHAFPRRLRDLVYRSVYANPALLGKRIAVQIYALTSDRLEDVDGAHTPQADLMGAIDRAASLPTGMQLESASELEDLMTTGQATAVASLIRHIEERFGETKTDWPEWAVSLHDALKEEWETINTVGRSLRPVAPPDLRNRRAR